MPRAEHGHPGAFGVERRHHFHEGVDLYTPPNAWVFAMEAGVVVQVRPFTGAALGHTWWNDTDAVFVQGPSGIIVYGEMAPAVGMGDYVRQGQPLGRIARVLKKDKGRPMDMLHLELRDAEHSDALMCFDWHKHLMQPPWLRDPTPWLLRIPTSPLPSV